MPLTKTTTRALAASIVIVAAGATVAGAAVFHLPILGFGRTEAASANVSPTRTADPARVAPEKVRPKVIVKTKYVTDVVHRPAPASASTAGRSTAPPPSFTVSSAAASVPTSAFPATLAPAPSTSPSTAASWSDDSGEDHHESEYEDDTAPSTDTSTTQAPSVDR